jgi:hypothetical protein
MEKVLIFSLMKFVRWIGLVSLLFPARMVAQRPKPASAQDHSILIQKAILHLGNGKVIQSGYLGFRHGKITYVDSLPPEENYDEVIEAEGKAVFPGFILPNSTLGLIEIGAVRATRDHVETGSINPNVRTLIAYNTDSRIIPTIRKNGVLIVQVAPQGGRISGTSSIFYLDGWNWEDAVLHPDDGIHLHWPSFFVQKGWWAEGISYQENTRYLDEVRELYLLFTEAKHYDPETEAVDLRLRALRHLFTSDQRLYIHVNGMREVMDAFRFLDSFHLSHPVLVVGSEVAPLLNEIAQRKIPLIYKSPHSLPPYEDSDHDLPYRLPSEFHKRGILFCIDMQGGMETISGRNLPFVLGTAIAYGLPYEVAVQTATLSAATILGIENRVGSLEVGKDATFFICKGDPFDMRSHEVTDAFIQGKRLNLQDYQEELYQRYLNKDDEKSR